jgi:hypothetical protein
MRCEFKIVAEAGKRVLTLQGLIEDLAIFTARGKGRKIEIEAENRKWEDGNAKEKTMFLTRT